MGTEKQWSGIRIITAAPPPPRTLETATVGCSLRIPHPWKILRRSEVLLFVIFHALQNHHHNVHLYNGDDSSSKHTSISIPGLEGVSPATPHTLLAVMSSSPATSLGKPPPQDNSVLRHFQISSP